MQNYPTSVLQPGSACRAWVGPQSPMKIVTLAQRYPKQVPLQSLQKLCRGWLERTQLKPLFTRVQLLYSFALWICSPALAPASPSAGGRDFGVELQFPCSVPPKEAGREQPWGCWGDAGLVAWPQPPQAARWAEQASETAITRARMRGFVDFFVDFLVFSPCFPLFEPWSWMSERIWSKRARPWFTSDFGSKLGVQLPCPVVPGELDGLVAAAVNWAAA